MKVQDIKQAGHGGWVSWSLLSAVGPFSAQLLVLLLGGALSSGRAGGLRWVLAAACRGEGDGWGEACGAEGASGQEGRRQDEKHGHERPVMSMLEGF